MQCDREKTDLDHLLCIYADVDNRTSLVLNLCVVFPFDFSSVNMPDNMRAELFTVMSVVTLIALSDLSHSSLFAISAMSMYLCIDSLIHFIDSNVLSVCPLCLLISVNALSAVSLSIDVAV